MEHNAHEIAEKHHEHGTVKSYIIGFALSLILTLAAYFIVERHWLSSWMLELTISFIALAQAVCQLLFFLHLGNEPKPRWNTLAFFFMFLVIVIIVAGSLWIMHNLDDRTMNMSTM